MKKLGVDGWGAIAGVAFVVLLIGGLFLLGDSPEGDASDAEITAFYDDDGNLTRNVIGLYAWVAAAGLFLWFSAAVRKALQPAAEQGGSLLAAAQSAGTLLAGLIAVAAAALVAVQGAILFGQVGPEQVGTDAIRLFPQLGWSVLLIAGGLLAAFYVLVVSVTSTRNSVFPTWLNWLGIVAGVLLLAGVFFVPFAALLIWVLAMSGVLLRRAAQAS